MKKVLFLSVLSVVISCNQQKHDFVKDIEKGDSLLFAQSFDSAFAVYNASLVLLNNKEGNDYYDSLKSVLQLRMDELSKFKECMNSYECASNLEVNYFLSRKWINSKEFFKNPLLDSLTREKIWSRRKYLIAYKKKEQEREAKELYEAAHREEILKKEQELETINLRAQKGEEIREYFLDKGYDIKVKVYGKNNTKIKFTFALFNDVWSYKFQQQGYISDLFALGFKKVEMSDNYEWGVYWDNK